MFYKLIPVNERQQRRKRRKSEVTKIKLPTQMQSKNMPKCPICQAPYYGTCLNCGYKRLIYDPEAERIHKQELFQSAKEVNKDKDNNEDQFEGNE